MPSFIEIVKGLWTFDPEILKWYVANGRAILDVLHIIFDKTFYIFLYATMAFTSIYLIFSAFVIFSRKKQDGLKFIPEKAPSVTIQIPTKNEIIALRCAKRCLEFDYPQGKFDILIGDDSTDSAVSAELNEFAERHADKVNVLKREDKAGFKPGNLNNMLKHTKGDIIVIFDSDFTPDKDFLKRVVTPFIYDKDVSAVQAKWNFNNFDQNLISVGASIIVYVFHHIVLSFMHLFKSGSLCGSAEAVRKKDLVELGAWVSGSLTEDIEYSLRLHKAKKKIVYLPDLQCYSDVPYVAKDLYKQQMRWAYGVITSYRMHIKYLLLKGKLSIKQRLLSLCAGFGYCMPILMFGLFVFGTLSFVTNRPAPIDIPKFLTETVINIILTSGLLVASIISLYRENKFKYIFKLLVSSFSIGLVTTYYVNKGIFKSLLRKPMEWYLLNKDINSIKQ